MEIQESVEEKVRFNCRKCKLPLFYKEDKIVEVECPVCKSVYTIHYEVENGRVADAGSVN